MYIHTWHLPNAGAIVHRFAGVELSPRSRPAHNLRERLKRVPVANALALAYVGYTLGTVSNRYDLDMYENNKLMRDLWVKKDPTTLIAFELPQEAREREGSVKLLLEVFEFLVAEMLGAFGRGGFNQQPGGPFNGTQRVA